MEKREYTKRLVLEIIRKKVEELGASKKAIRVRLYQGDFLGKSGAMAAVDIDDVPEAIIELEKDTAGEVRLVSTTPQLDGGKEPAFAGVDAEKGWVTEHPRYYEVIFDKNPKPQTEPEKQQAKEHVFFWLPEKGICRMYGNDEMCYPVTGMRRKILEALTEDFTPTELLAEKVGAKSNQHLSSQIGQIRDQIKKFRGVDPMAMIEGRKGYGYRIGKGYKIGN